MDFQGCIRRIDATTKYEQDGRPYQVVRVTFEAKMTADSLAKLQRWAEHAVVDIGLAKGDV